MCNEHGEMRVNNLEILAIVRKGLSVQGPRKVWVSAVRRLIQ